MPTLDAKSLDEQSQGLARAAGLIVVVFVVGVVGYRVIGGSEYTLLDAIYMTMITLTTVGYGEIIDLTHSPRGRLFTSVLLFVGVGSFVYFFSNLTAFMVEGNFDRILWRRKMRRQLNGLDQHFIICGAGRVARHMIRELVETERPFVVIELEESSARQMLEEMGIDFPVVVGDATDDAVLHRAKIDRAAGLCAAIANDRDNLVVCMTAHMLAPDLRIVARCTDERIKQKLVRAGASAVVSPNNIGGMRMVSELVRPDAVSFLDTMLRDKNKRLRIEEVAIVDGSKARGRTVGELRGDNLPGVLIVAVRVTGREAWTFHPEDDTPLDGGTSIVFMGGPEARRLAVETWS